jgi:oligopeptide transport system ATP-binding protein
MTQDLLEIDDLSVGFQVGASLAGRLRGTRSSWLKAVDGVDLAIGEGEVVGLVGESGCGKSTLGRTIVGLEAHERGHVRFDGETLPPRRSKEQHRAIQMVFQDPYRSLNPRMTVRQALVEVLSAHGLASGRAAERRCRELIADVGLDEAHLDAYPSRLSGGQRQRVSIARALALNPRLLVADEAVSALDVSVQATVVNLLADLRMRLGLSILFVSHNLAVVQHLCDRVAVMYLGRIVEVAPSDVLFANPQHPYTRALLAAVPRIGERLDPRHEPLEGDPPSPLNLPIGCRFHPRCPLAADACRATEPALRALYQDAHRAACHFAEPADFQPTATEMKGPADARLDHE